jgi:hypothetical protein
MLMPLLVASTSEMHDILVAMFAMESFGWSARDHTKLSKICI